MSDEIWDKGLVVFHILTKLNLLSLHTLCRYIPVYYGGQGGHSQKALWRQSNRIMNFWWHMLSRYDSAWTKWPVWSHCHRGTTSSDVKFTGCQVWWVGWMWLLGYSNPMSCVTPSHQEQGSTIITIGLSRTGLWVVPAWRACNKNYSDWHQRAVWHMKYSYALLLRAIMLNNNFFLNCFVSCASNRIAKLFDRPS